MGNFVFFTLITTPPEKKRDIPEMCKMNSKIEEVLHIKPDSALALHLSEDPSQDEAQILHKRS